MPKQGGENKVCGINEWFTVDKIDGDTFVISEYKHPEETHCYLLCGNSKSLLIDTGLGVGDISETVKRLTDKPVIAAATHIHWDHIGGHRSFPEFYAHSAELDWLNGKFPLPVEAVRKMLSEGDLPGEFELENYTIFQGKPSRILNDGDIIDLGGRTVEVIHTPGHSPGHMCFWEARMGNLFTGDLIYKGKLYANFPSTDPAEYLKSVKRLAELPVKRLFPGHHSLDVTPKLISDILSGLEKTDLTHGGGEFVFTNWSILL